MKIEARHLDRTHPIEIQEKKGRFEVKVGERVFSVRVLSREQDQWTLEMEGKIYQLLVRSYGSQTVVQWKNASFEIQLYSLRDVLARTTAALNIAGRVPIKAQMPGKVISVLVHENQPVEAGQGLVVIEAMKMQNEIKTPKKGKVVTRKVQDGGTVNAGDLLFEIE